MSDQPTTGEGEQLDIVDAVAKYGIKKLEPTVGEQASIPQPIDERDLKSRLDSAVHEIQQLRDQLAAEHKQVAFLERKLKEEVELHEQEEKQSDQSERDWSAHLRIQLAAEVEKVNKLQAQLAAEREDRISWQELYEKTNDQLAAERSERCEVCNSELSQCGVQGVDGEPSLDCLLCRCREQLAAEQEKVDEAARLLERVTDKGIALEQQLAAAVEALKLNMEWIGGPPKDKYSYDSLREEAWTKGKAALAKIGGK